jgi:hypothetical protein
MLVDAPQFIEGQVFKMELPVPEVESDTINDTENIDDTVNDTVNDTVSDPIKNRLAQIILYLFRHPGLRTNELAEKFNVSEVTIKRDMQKVRQLVEYRGSQKTGGYFLTDFMKSKLIRH